MDLDSGPQNRSLLIGDHYILLQKRSFQDPGQDSFIETTCSPTGHSKRIKA